MNLGGFKSFLSGKKTYLLAIGGLIAVLVGWSGDTITTQDAVEQVIALLMAMTIRAGISTSVDKVLEVKKND